MTTNDSVNITTLAAVFIGVLSVGLTASPEIALATPPYQGPKTGIVDQNGNQIFTSSNPGSVTGNFSATVAPVVAANTGTCSAIGTNTASIVVPADSTRQYLTYQVQGIGYGCISPNSGTLTVSSDTASATCTATAGTGYLVTTGSASQVAGVVEQNAIYAIGASGSNLQLCWNK